MSPHIRREALERNSKQRYECVGLIFAFDVVADPCAVRSRVMSLCKTPAKHFGLFRCIRRRSATQFEWICPSSFPRQLNWWPPSLCRELLTSGHDETARFTVPIARKTDGAVTRVSTASPMSKAWVSNHIRRRAPKRWMTKRNTVNRMAATSKGDSSIQRL
jgi:hypothetical protein